MHYVLKAATGRAIVLPCAQQDEARIIARCESELGARRIAIQHNERIESRRFWLRMIVCASIVALVSGLLIP